MAEQTPRERLVAHLIGIAGGDETETIVGLYSPSKRQVACVLIHAAFGGDRRVNNIMDAGDWFVAPEPDMRPIRGTLREWAMLATDAPEDRPGPEDFASGRMEGKDQATSETAA